MLVSFNEGSNFVFIINEFAANHIGTQSKFLFSCNN